MTSKLIAWLCVAFFALSLLPYLLLTWKLHTKYYFKKIFKITNKYHILLGYISMLLAIIHSLGWWIKLNFSIIYWFGAIGLLLTIISTILGYLYKKDKKKKIFIILHGLLFIIACILISIHITQGI